MTPSALTPEAPAGPVFGVDGHLVWQALAATRAAAIAAASWAGRGDGPAADDAATTAMRAVLTDSRGKGTVITGEGAKDDAPMLADGELIGAGADYDIAVDPLECTDLCAWGLPGALATIALGPRGSLWSPGPAYYMDKLIVPPAARGAARITDSPQAIVEQVAAALGKEVADVRIIVLDKPRHRDLIVTLRGIGASVSTPSAGDVAGALAVLLPDAQADLLLGVGGTPEGVLAACAVRALSGGMQGRLAPQRDEERRAIELAGIDRDRVLELDDLVASDATFVATGVTGGLLASPRRAGDWIVTDSIVIAAGAVSNIRQSTPTEE